MDHSRVLASCIGKTVAFFCWISNTPLWLATTIRDSLILYLNISSGSCSVIERSSWIEYVTEPIKSLVDEPGRTHLAIFYSKSILVWIFFLLDEYFCGDINFNLILLRHLQIASWTYVLFVYIQSKAEVGFNKMRSNPNTTKKLVYIFLVYIYKIDSLARLSLARIASYSLLLALCPSQSDYFIVRSI